VTCRKCRRRGGEREGRGKEEGGGGGERGREWQILVYFNFTASNT